MYQLFIDWFGGSGIPMELLACLAGAASLMVLNFLLDFFRFLMYYIARR